MQIRPACSDQSFFSEAKPLQQPGEGGNMVEEKKLPKQSDFQPNNQTHADLNPANQKHPDLQPANQKPTGQIEPPDGGAWVGNMCHFYC
jgi:hypothetical protein